MVVQMQTEHTSNTYSSSSPYAAPPQQLHLTAAIWHGLDSCQPISWFGKLRDVQKSDAGGGAKKYRRVCAHLCVRNSEQPVLYPTTALAEKRGAQLRGARFSAIDLHHHHRHLR